MAVLVTGGTGYIGRELSHKITQKCRYVVRQASKGQFDDEFVIDTLDGNTNWSGAFNGCESIIHLAGLAHSKFNNADAFHKVNVEGTTNLAHQAIKSGIKRFVFVSSIGVNGSYTKREPFLSQNLPNPQSLYARSKYDAEVALKKISKDTGLEVVIVRPPLVYGHKAPGNFGKLIKIINKLPVLPFGLVNNKRDFISINNLVDLLISCVTHPNAAGHTFLASDFETVSLKEFTNEISNALGKKNYQLPIPVPFMKFLSHLLGKSDLATQLFENLQIDSSDAKEILGWTPPFTMKQTMSVLSENKNDPCF